MKKLAYQIINFVAASALILGGYSNVKALTISGTRQSRSQSYVTSSNIYYVSLTGSDTNPGSTTAPFKTFARAVSVLVAGDTIQVLAGTYTEPLVLSKSGTNTAPITVVGNGAVLNMQGVNQNGITVSGSYINISRFEVIGAVDFGILITGNHNIVENNVIHDTVTKNGVGTCGISTSWSSALKVQIGGDNSTIRSNTVYSNCGEGIAVTRGVNTLIENNTAYDNFSANIYVDNSPYTTVRNNTSYCVGTHLRDGNRPTGIALGEEFYSGWGAQLRDVVLSGNMIKDCSTGIAVYESDFSGTLTNVTIANNNVPSGQKRSISIQTLTNQNVSVSSNTLFNSIYVYQPQGITLTGNIISSIAPTATSMPTNTPLPKATLTTSPVPASPTATQSVSTPTASSIPATPTATRIVASSTPTTAPVLASPTLMSSSTPSTSETIYDDKDGHFVYSQGWQNTTTSSAYAGSYKLTTLNGASATLTFAGNSFSVLYRGGTSYRKLNIYIDNVLVGTINEKASNSTSQMRWDYSGQLAAGSHTLKLIFVTANTSGGTKGSIDAVIVR